MLWGAVVCAQSVPLAGAGGQLVEDECPPPAGTLSVLLPLRAPGQRSIACGHWGCVHLGRGFP